MEQTAPVQNVEPKTSEVSSPAPHKSSGQAAIIGIIVAIVLLLAVIFIYKAYKSSRSSALNPYSNPVSQTAEQASPAPTPLAEQNAPSVIDQTSTAIEQDLNQMDTDMQTLNQNNTSQDNPNSI